jgi:alcohol dehydrogenase class IV
MTTTEVSMRFSFARMPRLEFAPGAIGKVPSLLSLVHPFAVLVTGGSSFSKDPRHSALLEGCRAAGSNILEFSCHGEPSVDFVDTAVRSILESVSVAEARGVAVVAVGGGSAIDAGKAIAAMLGVAAGEPGRREALPSVKEFLEGVGSRPPTGETAFLIACPTTAGTGSEATKNAVISQIGNGGFKKSLRHENYVPAVAVIDPELALGCPRSVTAASGLDALTQLIESWTSPTASPMVDSLCESGVAAFARSFDRVLADGGDLEARSLMAYAAFLSGVGLANAGLGSVHALASPVGALVNIPHGVVCGLLLESAARLNVSRLEDMGPDGEAALRKYAKAGYSLSSRGATASGESLSFGLGLLFDELARLDVLAALPRLGSFGIRDADLATLAAASSTKTNPVPLSAADYESLLRNRL